MMHGGCTRRSGCVCSFASSALPLPSVLILEALYKEDHVKVDTILVRQRRRLLLASSTLAATTLAAWTGSPVQAATVVNTDVPVSITLSNPCNGEIIPLSGMEHFVFRLTYDNNGGVHVGGHENIQLTGIDNDGNTYVGNLENLSDENAEVGHEDTSTLSFEVVSKESAPNFLVHAVFHVTVNPDGTVTARVADFTAECRG